MLASKIGGNATYFPGNATYFPVVDVYIIKHTHQHYFYEYNILLTIGSAIIVLLTIAASVLATLSAVATLAP